MRTMHHMLQYGNNTPEREREREIGLDWIGLDIIAHYVVNTLTIIKLFEQYKCTIINIQFRNK